LYTYSDVGYISIVDYSNPNNPTLTNFNVDLSALPTIEDMIVSDKYYDVSIVTHCACSHLGPFLCYTKDL